MEATPSSIVSVTSTPCVACGDPGSHTWRTPSHGSRPAVSCSGKTQRLPASAAASSAARPVAMWSAWLSPPPSQVSRKLLAMRSCGRTGPGTAAHRGRRGAGGDVVGLVAPAALPGVAEVAGDEDLRAHVADHLGDPAAQRDAVLQHAVRLAQEADVLDPDDPAGLQLLGLPQRSGLGRCDAVDAGLTRGH